VYAVRRHGRGSVALSFGSRNALDGKGEYSCVAKTSETEYAEFHQSRITQWRGFLDELWEEVEYLAFETVSSYEEARAIIHILDEVESTSAKKCWITFSCGDASVQRMEGIISRLLQEDISRLWGIGFNCVGIDIVCELARMLDRLIVEKGLVMVVYPDAGSWSERTTAQFITEEPTLDNEYVTRWAECLQGLSRLNERRVVLGGCCNTDPRFIASLKKTICQAS